MFSKIEDYSKASVLAHTIDVVEGGSKFTDDKDDNGGATRYGVTQRTAYKYPHLFKKFNWNGDMRKLPREFALFVCEDMFWDKLMLDEVEKICPITSGVSFDIAYNMGWKLVGSWIQEILNANNNKQRLYKDIAVDGYVGAKTIDTLKAFYDARGMDGIANLTYALTGFQTRRYYDIVKNNEKQEKWLYGWSDRAGNSLESYVPLFLKLKA